MESEQIIKAKQFWLKLGWIISAMLIMLIIGFLLYPKIVKGFEWNFNKNITCAFFNYSEQSCDSFWCNNFKSNLTSNCSWNNEEVACNCYINFDNSTIQNYSYFNKSEFYLYIDEKFNNLSGNLTNLTQIQPESNKTEGRISRLEDMIVNLNTQTTTSWIEKITLSQIIAAVMGILLLGTIIYFTAGKRIKETIAESKQRREEPKQEDLAGKIMSYK